MYVERKNDDVIKKAIAEQNRGNWSGAAQLFQRAGNQERPPNEKKMLWDAASVAHRIGSIE